MTQVSVYETYYGGSRHTTRAGSEMDAKWKLSEHIGVPVNRLGPVTNKGYAYARVEGLDDWDYYNRWY